MITGTSRKRMFRASFSAGLQSLARSDGIVNIQMDHILHQHRDRLSIVCECPGQGAVVRNKPTGQHGMQERLLGCGTPTVPRTSQQLRRSAGKPPAAQ